MELEKDYELRRCGSKIILRQIDCQTYEFKTALVADELIETKQYGLFILKYGSYFAACHEKNDQLRKIIGCQKYLLTDDKVLLYTDQWYWWTEDLEMIPLGRQIGDNSLVFLIEKAGGCQLNYFSEGKFEQVNGTECEILSGCEISFFKADLLKIKTEGRWLFVNVVYKREQVGFPCMRIPEYKTFSKVILSEEPSDKIIDYYEFVTKFQNEIKGFSFLFGFEDKFRQSVWDGVQPTNGLVLFPCFGFDGINNANIAINVDTWKMFNGEKAGIFYVRCYPIGYNKIADEAAMGELNGEPCLIIRCGAGEDKIVWRKKGLRYELELINNESAS